MRGLDLSSSPIHSSMRYVFYEFNLALHAAQKTLRWFALNERLVVDYTWKASLISDELMLLGIVPSSSRAPTAQLDKLL